jgi:hypothetical protein
MRNLSPIVEATFKAGDNIKFTVSIPNASIGRGDMKSK